MVLWRQNLITAVEGHYPSVGGPYVATLGNSLTLDGSASTDPDMAYGDSINTYWWDIDHRDVFAGATPTLSAGFVSSLFVGTHTLTLNVADSFSTIGSAATTLTVMDAPTTVPEPTGTVLLAIALVGLAGVCRLRRWGGEAVAATRG
jgi:hypothetical protein